MVEKQQLWVRKDALDAFPKRTGKPVFSGQKKRVRTVDNDIKGMGEVKAFPARGQREGMRVAFSSGG